MAFASPEEGKKFFDTMKVGNEVDIPLLAFSDIGPSGGNHFLTKFGDDVLIELQDSPGSYNTSGTFEPIYTARHESDTLYELNERAEEILLAIERGEYEDEDVLESDKQFAETIQSLVEEYQALSGDNSAGKMKLKLAIQNAVEDLGYDDVPLKWNGMPMPEEDEEYYQAFDDVDSESLPREYVSGGRLEVMEVKDDPSGLYKQVIVLRQNGAFDPQKTGSVVTIDRESQNRPRLSSGKEVAKKTGKKKTKVHDDAFEKKYGQKVPEGSGNCFSEAWMQAEKLATAYDRVRVVHGYPLGTGGEAKGIRFPHAWTEYTERGIEFVRDYSNGNSVEMPKALYYLYGNIAEIDTKKYTIEEAMQNMLEREHYGPW
jgi:hypothetical protein